MPSESGDRRTHPPPKLADLLPCPRCNSTNTKFCYYNNYNLSQPRHFCKACRRYWTHGGTLRNVPVGGGTRKNSKRSRSSSSSTSTSSSSTNISASTLSTLTHDTEFLRFPANPDLALPVIKGESSSDDFNLNDNLPETENRNLISLLNSTQQGTGLMGMVEYGPSFGYGCCEMGVGYGGRGGWAYPGMGYIGGGDLQGGNSGWQVGDGSEEAAGLIDGDCFSWPGLAISTRGKGLK